MTRKNARFGRMRLGRRAAAAAAICCAAVSASAEEGLAPPAAVVELFTSQGCYSCPPAEKVLAEAIAPHPGAVALELHVDYWDDLVYGGSVWKDPFSDGDYTRRQTSYNIKIRDTRTVYTPQAVIHGRRQASGTQKERILRAVEEVLQTPPEVRFRFSGRNKVRAEGALPPGAQIFYAIFWRERTTEIVAGENKGKVLRNTNVVTKLERLPFGVREAEIPAFDGALQDCAVWLQQGLAGRILSAARCPAA
ncbi:MAG: DUF1223 domain-containing protein [Gammaproteobacteria bacterium]